MGHLPIPANIFFEDFEFDLLEYTILNRDTIIGSYRGLTNSDEDGDYIGFLTSDQPPISVGSTLLAPNESKKLNIRQVSYDYYNGQPELLKAYY